MSVQVFIVDDVKETTEALEMMYASVGGEVIGHASTSREALDQLAVSKPDMVSLDIQLGDENGLQLCKEIRALYPDLFIVMCSMEASPSVQRVARESGANFFAAKPVSSDEVRTVLRECQYRHHQKTTEAPSVDVINLLDSILPGSSS